MKEFTIKRSEWLRGEGSDESYLRRDDDKRCCLGFYLEACGVDLLNMNSKAGTKGFPRTPGHVYAQTEPQPYPKQAEWLIDIHCSTNLSKASNELMKINDQRYGNGFGGPDEAPFEVDREAKIVEIFKNHGITVKFED